MSEDADTGSDLPVRELARALAGIGWGVLIASMCGVGFSTFQGGSRSSIDFGAVAGSAVVLVGLHDLPFDRAPHSFAARRRTLMALVGVSLVAAVATLVPPLNPVMYSVGMVTTWIWQILLLVLVGRVMAYLRVERLARWWRRLTVMWLALRAVSLVYGMVLLLASQDAPTSAEGAWALNPAALLGVALLAAAIATLAVGLRTLGWLRRRADDLPRANRGPSVPLDAPGSDAPRLGRDGDRIIYYVDKDD